MFFIWKIEYVLFFSPNCKGWTFIFLWALLFLLVTVAGITSLVSNDFSVLRKTDDLLDVRGHLKHFQLSIFNRCSFFDLFSSPPFTCFPSSSYHAFFFPSPAPLSPFLSPSPLLWTFCIFGLHLHTHPESMGAIDCCCILFPAAVLLGFSMRMSLGTNLSFLSFRIKKNKVDYIQGKHMFMEKFFKFLAAVHFGVLGCDKNNLYSLPSYTVNRFSMLLFLDYFTIILLCPESQERRIYN